MMHIYIYIYLLAPIRCDYRDPCHLRLAMPTFRYQGKVTSHRIFGWKFGTLLECLGKHRLGPHPFKSQTLKPPLHAKPQKAMPKSCFYFQSPKIKVLPNKGLPLDKRCWVPNTFPTCNQTSGPKNQDFCHPH